MQEKYVEYNPNSTEVIVCLHGYAGSPHMYEALAHVLSTKRLICINLPANLEKSKIFTLAEIDEYICEILKDLKITEYSIIGFSLGGVISVYHAAHHKVRSLVVLNSFPSLILSYGLRKVYVLLKPLILTRTFLRVYSSLSTSVFLRKVFAKPLLGKHTYDYMQSHFYSVFGTLFNCIDFDGLPLYKNLSVNKLLLLNRDDEVVNFKKYAYACDAAKLSYLCLMSGGHNTKADYWSAAGPAVANFLL